MGGGKDTRKKLTTEDVKKDLYKQAAANTRELLRQKTGTSLDSSSQLEDAMLPLAEWKFRDEYQLSFSKDPSAYTTSNLPDVVPGSVVTPVAQLCSITEGSDIDGYVETVLLSKVDLPAWMSGTAKAALRTLAKQLTSQDTYLTCEFDQYQQTFDGQHEDEDSWRAKGTIVYMTGSLLEDDITANITIIYFMAIYYKTNSPTRNARNYVQAEALKTGRAYTGWSQDIKNASDLDNALASYSANSFKKRFGFSHTSTSPPGTDPAASAPFRSFNMHSFYYQDLKTENLNDSVQSLFLQGFSLPPTYQGIKDQALSDVVKHIVSTVANPRSGSWSDSFTSQQYFPRDPTLNTVQFDVVYVHFYEHKTADNGVTVSNTYIYCLGLMWETLSPEKVIAQDMLDVMVNHLRKQLNMPPQRNAVLTELKDDIFQFAKTQFKDMYGYEYKGDASEPKDIFKKGAKVRGYSGLTHFTSFPVAQVEVTDWITHDFFPRDTNKFPSHASAKIYDKMVEGTNYCLKHTALNSQWDSNRTDFSIDPPACGGSKYAMKADVLHVFGLADMSEQGIHRQLPYVYLLAVFRSVVPESEWE